MTSAAEAAAFSNSLGLLPGTASSLRFRRAGACSTMVKLMSLSPGVSRRMAALAAGA